MTLTDTDILFASLVGSQIVKTVPKIGAVQNELMKHVGYPVNILPIQNKEVRVPEVQGNPQEEIWRNHSGIPQDQQFFPLTLEIDGNRFLLPFEPMINISGKNEIVRRNIAKPMRTEKDKQSLGGKVKERWNRDDYEITITGALMGSIMTGRMEDTFPRQDFQRLAKFLTEARSIRVFCEPLHLLGIDYIVVEDFSFPFTKGENVQAYVIKAYSDRHYKLLLDIND